MAKMSEKEKGQKGLLYNANYDEKLIQERIYCKNLCYSFNMCPPAHQEERKQTLLKILGRTDGDFLIEPSFWCDYGYNIKIGKNFYANHGCVITDEAEVIFGDNVFIGPNCGFYTAGHPLSYDLRAAGLEYAKKIVVGNDVWFGGNVVVLPGVTIGDDTIVGAGSVVTRDIPSGVVAAGNPCRVIRSISEEEREAERRSVQ